MAFIHLLWLCSELCLGQDDAEKDVAMLLNNLHQLNSLRSTFRGWIERDKGKLKQLQEVLEQEKAEDRIDRASSKKGHKWRLNPLTGFATGVGLAGASLMLGHYMQPNYTHIQVKVVNETIAKTKDRSPRGRLLLLGKFIALLLFTVLLCVMLSFCVNH